MASVESADISWGRIRGPQGRVLSSVIRQTVQIIAERFRPDKIIMFGSYARGCAGPDSDVDLLAVMAARNEIDQSLRIEESLDPPFPLDVIVRTPRNLKWRLEEGDWFLREAVGQGKVLYEKADKTMGTQGRKRAYGAVEKTAM